MQLLGARRRKEAVQGSEVACGLLPRSGRLGRSLFVGVRRRFMAGRMKRPAIGGRGLVGGTVVILNRAPEASACGRFFPLSAHARRPPGRGRRVISCEAWWGGRGHDPSPEPPLLIFRSLGLCFGGACGGIPALEKSAESRPQRSQNIGIQGGPTSSSVQGASEPE
jgi:hypothetical protein